ncbi:DUF6884 domain-containing protein [Bradyrhizobium ottawaense]|uniref:DUF6884 domain-containing protein n=1 Tax=Bradyrhizobium ottawaense TaxID=931866 RepID=A0ABY0QH37_9BRAD|nr:DUF6884 domain-containing protein [Bradyrhizobium ottawaense]SDK38577.1 hypothetical protein SAMN05444163_7988 [Bradyrhizobium ottawaense]SDK46587.1 hypothetical protein SAMN05444163_8181 [Bradyrhizobium ottawaense]
MSGKADVAFVSCVKTKANRPMPAKDFYLSPWFRLARRYVEKNAHRWYILSAAHGCIHPEDIIDPYDVTLNGASAADRGYWAVVVRDQFDKLGPNLSGERAIIFAGLNYRRDLISPLLRTFDEVQVPMEGLKMGQQLSWLTKHNDQG